jgi:methionyl-tRNA synthetase
MYITTSRPYTNASPHLGTIMDPIYADVYARYYRSIGENVFFSMGTDEHSFKIVDKAAELGITPREHVDKQYTLFEKCFSDLSISSDNFIQSSHPKHHWISNIVWEKLKSKGLIYLKDYDGLYCTGCEDFYSESNLVDGKCPTHTNLNIQKITETNYFFGLSKLKSEILSYLKTVTINNPHVITEMRNLATDAHDISISRDRKRLSVDWGIPVWSDLNHLMYVWFEALLTYITPLVSDQLFESWAQADSDSQKELLESQAWENITTGLPQNIHSIGTDNSKFHLIIWPAMLIALGLPPITSFIDHGMILDTLGRKFAKSLGNGVQFDDLYAKIGSEGCRFFVLFYCASNGDTNFDWGKLYESYNSMLSNNLGNLVSRVSNLVEKYLGGKVTIEHNWSSPNIGNESIIAHLLTMRPELAIREVFTEFSKINLYLEQHKPWELGKDMDTNEPIIREHLTYCTHAILHLTTALSWFLPETATKIHTVFTAETITKSAPLFERKVLETA